MAKFRAAAKVNAVFVQQTMYLILHFICCESVGVNWHSRILRSHGPVAHTASHCYQGRQQVPWHEKQQLCRWAHRIIGYHTSQLDSSEKMLLLYYICTSNFTKNSEPQVISICLVPGKSTTSRKLHADIFQRGRLGMAISQE